MFVSRQSLFFASDS